MPKTALVLALVLTGVPSAWPAAQYRVIDRPADALYYGRVSTCDSGPDAVGARVERDDSWSEPARINLPLAPGDRLFTPAAERCEAEFDTGTVVRLDGGTAIRIETVLAPSLTSGDKLTNLVLESGRLHVQVETYARSEVFQILTPNASVKVGGGSSVDVRATSEGGTRLVVEKGNAAILYGPTAKGIRRVTVKAGESWSVLQGHEALRAAGAPEPDDFSRWSTGRDQRRVAPPTEARPLPAMVRGLPRVVADFAERVSRAHGKWVWTSTKQHAWRPDLNDDPGWRPYSRGRFTVAQGRPFWVADEEWGWAPYHFGLWDLDDDAGWIWLPGSTFAPAWVALAGCADSLAWWPFGPREWANFRRGEGFASFAGCEDWYRYPWMGAWDTVDAPPPRPQAPRYAKPRGATGPEPAPTPRPDPPTLPPDLRDLRAHLDRLAKEMGFDRPDAGRRAEVRREVGPSLVKIQAPEKSAPKDGDETVPASASAPVPPAASPYQARFRDWNPDVRAARVAGVTIRYDSSANRVVCVGCGRSLTGGTGDLATGQATLSASSSSDAPGAGVSGTSVTNGGGAGGNGGAKSGPIDK